MLARELGAPSHFAAGLEFERIRRAPRRVLLLERALIGQLGDAFARR